MRWQNANRLRDLWTGYLSDRVSRCAADFGSPRLRTSCSSPTTKTFFCFKTLLRKWFLFFSFAAYSEGGYTVGLTSRPSLDSTGLRCEVTSLNPTSPIIITSISLVAVSVPLAIQPAHLQNDGNGNDTS